MCIRDRTPEREFENHVYHRDQFAHYLWWTHVLKVIPPKATIMDVGCGSGEMVKIMYHNRRVPWQYIGIDVRTKTIQHNQEVFTMLKWASFKNLDFCKPQKSLGKFDFVTCFEVIEHLGKQNGDQFLANIVSNMDSHSVLLLSTPCYNGIDVADNHIIQGKVGEYTFKELKYELEKFFKIEKVWGTFASQKDYMEKLTPEQEKIWQQLSEYYDSNLISVLFAPLFPEQSRNCLWQCRLDI